MLSTGHVATAPVNSSDAPVLTRRDLRALENRVRRGRVRSSSLVTVPRSRAPGSTKRAVAATGAMALITLFTVSASLPALAVNPADPNSAPTVLAHAPEAQTLSVTSTAAVPLLRDGFTVTAVPTPASYTDIASDGVWASLTANQLSDAGWALPVLGRISSPHGPRLNRPVAGVGAFHHGTDIAAQCGRPVFAANAGTVETARYQGSYGNWVLLDHGDGVKTGYAHNSRLLVTAGQTVAAGEIVALVGTTGASSGCHVHFETRVGGALVDAETFMSSRGVTLG
ncbi:MAG: M23 family metallopeptidase [Cryobacterium sp.]